MKKALRITVKNKIATYHHRDGAIVCGNKGYKIEFTFDAEWDSYPIKTARFIWNGRYYDQTFSNDECDVPVINDAKAVTVGVYAGDLKTTTPAEIPCLISILCGNPELATGMVKDYREKAALSAEEAKKAAEEAKAAASVVVFPSVNTTEIFGGHRITITDAEGIKTFDVMDGKGVLSLDESELLKKLSNWYDKENYAPMTATFTMSPVTTIYELGTSKTVKFSWTFSKVPIEVRFNNVAQTAAESGSVTETVSSSSRTTKTYKLYGKYKDGETVSPELKISFQNKCYYGVAAQPTLPDEVDSDFIKSLCPGDWATSQVKSFTANCTNGKYVWYAYPKVFGTARMGAGYFQGGFNDPFLVPVTNSVGYTENYYVYRSTESVSGTLDVWAK